MTNGQCMYTHTPEYLGNLLDLGRVHMRRLGRGLIDRRANDDCGEANNVATTYHRRCVGKPSLTHSCVELTSNETRQKET